MAKRESAVSAARKRGRSIEDERAFIKAKNTDVPVPKGYTLDPETERPLWETFSRGRASSDWLPHELVLLVTLVKNVSKAERLRKEVEKEGVTLKVTSKKGNAFYNPNPKFAMQMKLEQHIGIQLRQLRLVTPAARGEYIENSRHKKALHQTAHDETDIADLGELLQLTGGKHAAN